jgi:undecaprenyl-diphosphatase
MRFLLVVIVSFSFLFSFELDKKVTLDDEGFWGAHYDVPRYFTIATLAVAAYEGTESRIGLTSWKSLEAGLMSQALAEIAKRTTQRTRPRATDNPDSWGDGGHSFFSGHVSGMAALVTPFVLEYKDEHPSTHLLWLLPAYQMVGRVKAQAHWQSDVIVGALVGFASGYWAHKRKYPLSLYFDGDKVVAGLKHKF